MDACDKMNVPLIAHFHGFDAYRQRTLETYGRRYPELFEIAEAIVAVSRDMQAQLIKLGAPADKVHYNSCGVEPSVFKGADPLHSPPTFVAVGRFVNKKAPHLTLLAFKAALENCPEARLVMIGDGPLWEACRQMTVSLGLSDSVDLQGVRSQAEVATAMQQARAFVQHSITTHDGDSEGTPVAVLEAGASGLPVVSTRHAGIKDAVIHEKTGFLVAEGDIARMAEHMTTPGERSPIGRRSRQSRQRVGEFGVFDGKEHQSPLVHHRSAPITQTIKALRSLCLFAGAVERTHRRTANDIHSEMQHRAFRAIIWRTR